MERFYISENNFKQIKEPCPTLGLDVPEYLNPTTPQRLVFKVKLGPNSLIKALGVAFGGDSANATLFFDGMNRKISGDCLINCISMECGIDGAYYNAELEFCAPIAYEVKK